MPFITFEGGEGTGKTTQIHRLESWLKDQGHQVIVTFEPGGTALGQKVREILLDNQFKGMDAKCEALLYAATRAEHVAKVIRPALEQKKIVLCDRYWDASRAYQGAARGLGIEAIDRINFWGTGDCAPDHVFVFDFDVAKGLKRVAERQQGHLDRLESEGLGFHEKVRQAYLAMALKHPKNYSVIDASCTQDEITTNLQKALAKALQL
jgi:dTMP kinase